MRTRWKAALVAAAVVLPATAWAQDEHRGGGDHPHGQGSAPQAARPAGPPPGAPAPRSAPPANGGVQAQGGFQGRPGGYRFNGEAHGQAGAPGDFRRGNPGQPGAGAPGEGRPYGQRFNGGAPGAAPQQFDRQPDRGGDPRFGGGQPGQGYRGGDPRFGGGQPGQNDRRGDPRFGGYAQGGPQAQAYRNGDGRFGYGQPGGPGQGQAYRGNPGGRPGGYDPRFRQGGYGGRGDWNNGWRNDRRYDWNRYRAENRGIFHLRPYYAPRGWGYGYQRFAIGVTLEPFLWAQDYWIDDPWYFRLPPAYGPYRWVRYYNDALLVDVDTGEVVDTVYGIFY